MFTSHVPATILPVGWGGGYICTPNGSPWKSGQDPDGSKMFSCDFFFLNFQFFFVQGHNKKTGSYEFFVAFFCSLYLYFLYFFLRPCDGGELAYFHSGYLLLLFC